MGAKTQNPAQQELQEPRIPALLSAGKNQESRRPGRAGMVLISQDWELCCIAQGPQWSGLEGLI